jgi:hypothetical protein
MSPLAIPSDEPPKRLPGADFGAQFHYFRGASGRRYLFTAVSAANLDDFSLGVGMIAEKREDGGLIGRTLFLLSPEPAPHRPGTSEVALVHLLAPTESARLRAIADLAGARVSLAA